MYLVTLDLWYCCRIEMQTTIGALPSHKPGCRPGLAVPRFYSRPALAARPSTAASLQNPEQQSLAADDCRLPQRTLVAALIALTTATALPWQADAKKTEPPPKPTTYDVSCPAFRCS